MKTDHEPSSGLHPACARLVVLLLGVAIPVTAKAANVYPVATNPAAVEFCGGAGSDGTNYLIALTAGTNVSWQLVGPNGALIGTNVIIAANAGFPPQMGVASGATNYLVVWSDKSITSGVDLFGQFIWRNGAPSGTKFPLLAAQGSYGFQVVQGVASDGTNFLVVWQDKSTRFFYGQLVTGTGALFGAEFPLSSQQQNGSSAAVAFGRTNYLVVWQSNNASVGNTNQTYAQTVSAAGFAGGIVQVSQSASTDNNIPAVAFDGTNFLVVWSHDTAPPEQLVLDWDLYGRLVSPTGALPGGELHLVTDSGDQAVPALAFDGSCYLLAWSDYLSNTNRTGTNQTIRFRFFDRAGQPAGSKFTVFSAQGTNSPLFSFHGLLFDGVRLAIAATLGSLTVDTNGNLTGLANGDVYGAFIPRSTAAPRLDPNPPFANGQFRLHVTGTPGINYALQFATNLLVANTLWTTLGTNASTDASFAFDFVDTSATNRNRFYRAITP